MMLGNSKTYNKTMLLKVKCMAKTRHAFAFSKLWRYNLKRLKALG